MTSVAQDTDTGADWWLVSESCVTVTVNKRPCVATSTTHTSLSLESFDNSIYVARLK